LVLFSGWRSCRGAAEKVVELGLSIASVAYGALLGVFARVLTRRANEHGSMIRDGDRFLRERLHLAGSRTAALACSK